MCYILVFILEVLGANEKLKRCTCLCFGPVEKVVIEFFDFCCCLNYILLCMVNMFKHIKSFILLVLFLLCM